MNPPHDAETARCMGCRQVVGNVVIHPTTSGTWLLCTCPHCGAVWNVVPKPPASPPPRY
jgi:hypothetical protein